MFRTEEAKALFAGVAAHTFRPLHYPMTAAIGMGMGMGIITAGHRHGWPVAAGGSPSIIDALAGLLVDLGSKIETNTPITSAAQLSLCRGRRRRTRLHAGRMPQRPFVLVGQQYLADPQRAVGDVVSLWTYAHVPHGYTGDATGAIIAQVERFAPGFHDRIVGHTVRSTTEMSV